jgi:hypothetical protein
MPRVEPRRPVVSCGSSHGGGRRYGGGCAFGRRTNEETDGRQEKGEKKRKPYDRFRFQRKFVGGHVIDEFMLIVPHHPWSRKFVG